jgi:hypothetical protein
MNIAQIIDALPLQVYVRRGELVIHFSTPADLVNRLAETSASIADLDRQLESLRPDSKPERAGRRASARPAGATNSRSEAESDCDPAADSDQGGQSG